MMEPSEIVAILKSKIDGAEVLVEDLTGTKDHFQAVVVSPAFAGKSMIEQHQLVYAALKEQMVEAIHALTLKTYTPQEWQAQSAAPRGIS